MISLFDLLTQLTQSPTWSNTRFADGGAEWLPAQLLDSLDHIDLAAPVRWGPHDGLIQDAQDRVIYRSVGKAP